MNRVVYLSGGCLGFLPSTEGSQLKYWKSLKLTFSLKTGETILGEMIEPENGGEILGKLDMNLYVFSSKSLPTAHWQMNSGANYAGFFACIIFA